MKRVLLACALVITTGFSIAQDFPNRPIRIVVPSSPGGSVDRLTRAIGQELQTRVGQPVIIENKPGAGGTIGAEATAAAAPDGYTLMMGTVASLATNTTMENCVTTRFVISPR
jgi:tripartite-type tricarboxylate transporter receptor subunit TctC